jgi:hypothetical protein
MQKISADSLITSLCFDSQMVKYAEREKRKALRILSHAFAALRPRMQGDTLKGVAPNGEALAGRELAAAMLRVIRGQS